ncbi:response regulator transcription factor [Sulfurospirillum sp. 1612]|uniref:response regulator transcription factor n=1 Tax=Sulfurospirillum sp. 1612 TaxID=3094835 RepID=UPI002F95324F
MKLLIIEDDAQILAFLKRGLLEDGYLVESATEGEEGLYMAMHHAYDIIVLDWMLPGKDGLEIIASLRAQYIKTPIIMLTAKDGIKDRVNGLRCGADDYVPKPFSYEELVARIEALHRRDVTQGSNTIEIGDLLINLNAKIVKKADETLELTAKEYELLLFLIKHKNAIVSNTMIESGLWGDEEYINSNVIQVTVYHLRKKIGKDLIKSYRGLGYKIEI